MQISNAIYWYLAAMSLPAFAHAQAPARPDPADPKTSVPPVIYVSPLKQYRPLPDEPLASWRAANEEVEKIGGWQAYAKESQEPAAGAVQPASPVQKPTSGTKPATQSGHQGHTK